MSSIKGKDIVMLYKKMLTPMGYTVVPIVEEQDIPVWEPKGADKYEVMGSVELEQTITELKSKMNQVAEFTIELKEKTIQFMNKQTANDFTEQLYKGTYAANSILKTGVVIHCKREMEYKKLLEYLQGLKLNKLNMDMIKKFRDEQDGILNMDIDKSNAKALLIVEVE